ncbi:hypothetical protein [Rhodanobacter sp. MP7CTX1]|uniref:hypothetical protein n=1 Tax=Rhodanobacter sp. MP7CTX1 TaxID=2723084 RepID=UPI00161DF162|nr:hypothetical protein [Rhodanobacter sp. MP7CTX1]MBB6189345.1 hypothetical protein [Rhodanobacter sp. MP7CTX1]
MIELEIQTLSERREGLLIELGRAVVTSGFTLQRQRFTHDANGVLLTMIVRGPARKQRELEAALDANERIISFNASTFEEGAPKPHFAASRMMAAQAVVPAPAPTIDVVPVVATVAAKAKAAAPVAVVIGAEAPESFDAPVVSAEPDAQPEPEPEPEFIFVLPRTPSPAPAAVAITPFVELIPEGPDEEAVVKVLPKLENEYPLIFQRLQTLERSVPEAARESSLWLAGQRTGVWVFERDYAPGAKLGLREAIEHIGMPALRALVEVEHKGEQLHIRNSPLCIEGGQSSCKFFSGYLEGLLGAAVGSDSLSVFAVCCRSCGADECVLAISD